MLGHKQYEYFVSFTLISNQMRNMIIEKQKQKRAVNKPERILFPFRQIAVRSRVLHRLNPQEMMVRKGI